MPEHNLDHLKSQLEMDGATQEELIELVGVLIDGMKVISDGFDGVYRRIEALENRPQAEKTHIQ